MVQENEKTAPPARRRPVAVAAGVILILVVGGILLFFNGGIDGLFAGGAISGQEERPENSGPAQMYGLPEFLVNLADENSRCYLKTVIYLGFNDPALAEELERRKPEVRDVLINILRQKTSADLKEPGGTDALRREILAELNDMFHEGELEGIYFWDFIVQ